MTTNTLQLVPRDSIQISPDRQRKEFEPVALNELSETIRLKGLMHAPVMRELDGQLFLVAGERRIRAIDNLWMLGGALRYNGMLVPEGSIPYVTLGQLDPLAAEEAELEENLHRKDLTWQESSAAMAKLHSLRSKQATAEGRIHTVADTTMETKGRTDGWYQAEVRKQIAVARHLDNPEVQKAKTTEEAYKILQRQEQTQKNVALAVSVGKTFNSNMHSALNVDCLEWMMAQPGGQFDVILTDPPYGMGAQDFGDGGGKMVNSEHHYDDSLESWITLMQRWCPLAYHMAKPQAHAYVFCDQANFPALKLQMEAAGWYVFRTMLIAHKPNSGRVPLPTMGPRRTYETILYAIKGKKPTTGIYPDVISTNADANLTHGAQKPVALYEDLLKRSIQPGDSVLDAFSGSGTIFQAAHNLKVKATGLELNSEYFAMGYKRLKEIENTQVTGTALGTELMNMLGKGGV